MDNPGEWTAMGSVVASVVNVGFTGLVAWWLLTRGLPNVQEKFSADLKAQREDFHKVLIDTRNDARQILTMAIEARSGDVLKIGERVERLIGIVERDVIPRIDRAVRLAEDAQAKSKGGGG